MFLGLFPNTKQPFSEEYDDKNSNKSLESGRTFLLLLKIAMTLHVPLGVRKHYPLIIEHSVPFLGNYQIDKQGLLRLYNMLECFQLRQCSKCLLLDE